MLLLQGPVDLDRRLQQQLENDYAHSQDFPKVLRGNLTVELFLSSLFLFIDFVKVGYPFRILSDIIQSVM